MAISDEYASMKQEQLERIKQRDTFLHLNIVAIAVNSAIAVQGAEQALAWLVLSWISLILGWTYLSNDDKVSALALHLKDLQHAGIAPRWESGNKGLIPRRVRRVADAIVFTAAFLLPTIVGILLYSEMSTAEDRWHPLIIIACVLEILFDVGLLGLYVVSMKNRRI